MKQILISHDDLDGAGCRILFENKYPDIEIVHCNYNTIDEISKKIWNNRYNYDMVYFADITPNEKFGTKMASDPKFILIDHHITREYLSRLSYRSNIIYDTGVCATFLTAKYLKLYDDNFEFIFAVNAYDTWVLDSIYRNDGLNLNLLFDYYGMEKFVEKFISMRKVNDEETVIINVLKKLEDDYANEKLKQGKIKIDEYNNVYFKVYIGEVRGNLGSLINHPNFPKDCKYIKVININDSTVSLYSKDFNVAKICKARGGGGHQTAAGYQLFPW